MGRLKQFLVFLLVVITIYSTLLFYLLMSVHADSRLQEIDYLERSKFEGADRVLYLDKIVHLNDRFHHFTISLLRFRKNKPAHCPRSPNRAVLLISASGFDLVTIYMKLLRELEVGNGECGMPEVFVLKKVRPLTLGNQQNINKYAFEIGEIIKYITIEGEFDVTIFSHEEGAVLTLAYFARRAINGLFNNIVEKVKALVLVDITHPFIRIQYDPPYKMLAKLKGEIFSDQDRVKIFNKFKIVVLTTHKEDNHHSKFQFIFAEGEEPYVFANTVLISSREMANVHYYLPPNSLSFPPFVRRIGQFIAKISTEEMSVSEIHDYFRHGESYEYEKVENEVLQGCTSVQLLQDRVISRARCVKVQAITLNDSEILAIYSPNHFQMYSNVQQRLYPFDNLTEGSIYLLQQIKKCAYIINPEEFDIYITKKTIVSPRNPLSISEEEIYAQSQLIFSNYSIVSVCPNLQLVFPLHFAQGNAQRKFLVEGEGDCFLEDNILEEFSWQFFLHWSLFRNIIIFTLLCSEYRKQPLAERLIEQFFINLLLLMGREEIQSKFFYTLYIVSFSLLVEYLVNMVIYVCGKVTLKKKWANILLLAISGVFLISSALNIINVWSWFLFTIVFFINEDNFMIIVLKLYFLKDEILHGGSQFHALTEVGLLTMWLYTTLPSNKNQSTASWTPQRLFSGLLMTATAVSLDGSGAFIDSMLTIFMKVLIVVKMLRIIRK